MVIDFDWWLWRDFLVRAFWCTTCGEVPINTLYMYTVSSDSINSYVIMQHYNVQVYIVLS